MKQKWFWCAFVVILVLMSGFVLAFEPVEVPRIAKDELKKKLGDPNVVIIDMRRSSDWHASDLKIKGAVRETPGKAKYWSKKYDKTKTYILYCFSPYQSTSSAAARKLISLGFTKVYVLESGWYDWYRSGYPIQLK